MTSPGDGDHGSHSADQSEGQPGSTESGPAQGPAQPDGASPHHVTSAPDRLSEPDGTSSTPDRSGSGNETDQPAPPGGRPDAESQSMGADTQATTQLPAARWASEQQTPDNDRTTGFASPRDERTTSGAQAGSSADRPTAGDPRGGSSSGPGSGSDSGSGPGLPTGSSNEPSSGSGDDPSASYQPPPSGPNWASDETRDFPAYQAQSYPTYPPSHSATTTLPAVDAGGPPPTTAAAYAGTGPAAASSGPSAVAPGPDGATAASTGKPARRAGAGLAGALGLIGLSAAAVGAMGLPIQQFAQNQNVYFGTYRDLAGRKLSSNAANQHSISLVGGHIATDWWRFGVYITLGVLALLFLIKICVPALRRVAGVLLFLGGLAAAAGFLLGAHQTNDYRSVTLLGHIRRISWHHLAYGFWVAVAGCVVIALAGLIAMLQSTRR